MSTIAARLLGLVVALTVGGWLAAETPPAVDPAERVLRDHAKFLNEVSDRRRLNSLFANEQSPLYGVPVRYVNTSRGNLTFLRRDLVTAGRIPLVLARVYDSSSDDGRDFGPGWQLSLAERIVRHPNGTLTYRDDSASVLKLEPSGAEGFQLQEPGPSDIAAVEQADGALRIRYRGGWTKTFSPAGAEFRLAAIVDAHGNAVTLTYTESGLSRVEAPNGRFLAVERDAAGRVSRVVDDQQRTVTYRYDSHGQLEAVTDLGGNTWRYEYEGSGRLARMIDPRLLAMLEASYDSDGRVKSLAVLGAHSRYKYKVSETIIENDAGQLTRVGHEPSGLTTSVTNPEGLVSELLLDRNHRIRTLLHNGTPRASFLRDAAGRVTTLTRFDAEGEVDLLYEYDAAGRPVRISDAAGPLVTLEYSPSGDLLRRADRGQVVEYAYTPQGDLRSVSRDGQTTVYTHNSDGAIERIDSPQGITRLTYFPDGKVESIAFPDEATHHYRYNALGFRAQVERSDGTAMHFEYDVAGNLVRAQGQNADGVEAGQEHEIDAANRLSSVQYASGESLTVTYDANGNPQTLTPSGDEAFALEYLYDGANRLVAVEDAGVISGSYLYGPTEPDLRLQMDDRTARVDAGLIRQSNSVADMLAVLYTRPHGSFFDSVRFDEATQTIVLPTNLGISMPDAVPSNSLLRRKLIDIDSGTLEARVNFDRASNVMFLPPEYATINCINPCIFTGVTLTGNGLAGTLSVGGGTPVFLVASKQSGTTCNVFYDWTLNGAYMPWSSTGKQVYTFDNAGSYLVRALGECSPCDLTRIGQLTVNVSGNCSPGAAYDFHAPRFVRRAVSYPLTIAGTAAAITLKVYSSQSDFDQYGTAIEQLWTKNVPLCGVGYSIAVDLQLELNIANSWQLEIRSRSSLVDEENRPACGLYTPEATLGRPLLEVSRAIECPYWATNAAHEFGHELGFADAYDKDTKEPLHTQAADIMTAQGPGKVVLGAHGRILVEKYGR